MDRRIYHQMAQHEDTHWWFRARRVLVRRTIERFCRLPAEPQILDAGCGSGGSLEMLAGLGRVSAFEMDAEAAEVARARGVAQVRLGHLPDAVPFDAEQFDLVVMTDVLEHIEDDRAALRAVAALIRPGGWLVMTVPALRFLWSHHDATHHHFRRYGRSELRRKLRRAGLDVRWVSYHNSWLLPVVAGVRLAQRITGTNGAADDVAMPPRPVNELLYQVFASERHFIGRLALPLGVSVLACAQRPER